MLSQGNLGKKDDDLKRKYDELKKRCDAQMEQIDELSKLNKILDIENRLAITQIINMPDAM